jgi:purine-nucleoside phosphorylase
MSREIDRGLSRYAGRARTAVVLGSGLSSMEGMVPVEETVCYSDIPGFHAPTVEGHPGRLSLCRIGESHFLLFAGRFHMYEGLGLKDAGGTVSLAHELGCTSIIMSQAAGSLHSSLPERVWMLPSDIVLFPFRGISGRQTAADVLDGKGQIGTATGSVRDEAVHSQWLHRAAPRRPGSAISRSLREKVAIAAREAEVTLRDGVLFWTPGPQYETPAEARAALELGADAAGMSSVPELAAARQYGIEAVILCWITNYTPNVIPEPLHHEDVTGKGGEGAEKLVAVVDRMLRMNTGTDYAAGWKK